MITTSSKHAIFLIHNSYISTNANQIHIDDIMHQCYPIYAINSIGNNEYNYAEEHWTEGGLLHLIIQIMEIYYMQLFSIRIYTTTLHTIIKRTITMWNYMQFIAYY
eukprot:206754_1